MRLLLVADLHYSLPQYDWVLEMAPDFDVVVIAGDHLDVASLVDGRAQSVVIRKYFNRLREKTRLLICSGNHDLDSKNEVGEKIAKWLGTSQNEGVLSDGESVVVEGTFFTICPWWDGPIAREGIAVQLAEAAAKRTGEWIWIHHAPPAESQTSWGGARYFGDVELREWIERYKPDIVLSGHVHQSPFIPDGSWVDRIGNTWVFNAGNQPGPLPTHIIIDTETHEAFWFSAITHQFIRLDQPLERPVKRLDALPEWLRVVDPSRVLGQA